MYGFQKYEKIAGSKGFCVIWLNHWFGSLVLFQRRVYALRRLSKIAIFGRVVGLGGRWLAKRKATHPRPISSFFYPSVFRFFPLTRHFAQFSVFPKIRFFEKLNFLPGRVFYAESDQQSTAGDPEGAKETRNCWNNQNWRF